MSKALWTKKKSHSFCLALQFKQIFLLFFKREELRVFVQRQPIERMNKYAYSIIICMCFFVVVFIAFHLWVFRPFIRYYFDREYIVTLLLCYNLYCVGLDILLWSTKLCIYFFLCEAAFSSTKIYKIKKKWQKWYFCLFCSFCSPQRKKINPLYFSFLSFFFCMQFQYVCLFFFTLCHLFTLYLSLFSLVFWFFFCTKKCAHRSFALFNSSIHWLKKLSVFCNSNKWISLLLCYF